jgi:hypothetical protein
MDSVFLEFILLGYIGLLQAHRSVASLFLLNFYVLITTVHYGFTLRFPLCVTSNRQAISGWQRRDWRVLQVIAPLPEKLHGRQGQLPPIPGSLETLLT